MAKRITSKAPATLAPKPPVGEATPRQTQGRVLSLGGWLANSGTEIGRADYPTYRKMRTNPTIALVRAAATAPIKMAEWSVESDEGVPDEVSTLVQDVITTLWPDLLKISLLALDYGWSPAELVWAVKDGALIVERVKQLWVDITNPLVKTSTGELVGVRQHTTDLIGPKAFVFTYDAEADNPYGRSRHENIRENAWAPWVDTSKQMAAYFAKVAGVIPIMHYPAGQQAEGSAGQVRNNEDTAGQVLANLGKGSGIAIPWDFPPWAEEMLNRGIDPTQLVSWQLSFLETKGDHSGGFGAALRYYDSLICRGWLVPERAITEGQAGTKAEAEAHGDIALAVAADLLNDIIQAINRQIVDHLVSANFGPEYKGKVRVQAAPLVDADKAFIRQLVAAILTAPGNADLLFSVTDFDAMLDQARVPKSAQVVDVQEARAATPVPGENPPASTDPAPKNPAGSPRTLAASRSILMSVLDDIYRKPAKGGKRGQA